MHFGEGALCCTLWATKIRSIFSVKQPILLLAALACCLVLSFAFACSAWADEEESATQSVDTNGNVVNVNQMPDSSFLYNTDIADLAGAESFHDTQTVQVTGEVVGDHINDELDSNLCWITLQSTKADDYSLVSVLMTNEQAKLIENYGNYNTDGTNHSSTRHLLLELLRTPGSF